MNWIEYIALFLAGYVTHTIINGWVNRICEAIKSLNIQPKDTDHD